MYLNKDLWYIVLDYLVDCPMKFKSFVDQDKVDWERLSSNPAAIHILEKNLDNVYWICLSCNPAAIHILEKNLDKVEWEWLSSNPKAIHMLEKKLDKVKIVIKKCEYANTVWSETYWTTRPRPIFSRFYRIETVG